MLNDFICNEIFMSAKSIENKKLLDNERICIVGKSALLEHLKSTMVFLKKTTNISYECYDNSTDISFSFDKLIYCLDLENYDISDLNSTLSAAKGKEFICVVLSGDIKPDKTVMKYAEMEFLTAHNDKLNEIQTTLKAHINDVFIKELIVPNLFGCEINCKLLNFDKICADINDKDIIEIKDTDIVNDFSVTYICDAINSIFIVSKFGKRANVYLTKSYDFNLYEIKTRLYPLLFKYGIKISYSDSNKTKNAEKSYACVSCGKLNSIGYENSTSVEDALRYTLSPMLEKFDLQKDFINRQYDGKLSEIRNIELDILKEVDRICRENQINYFLSGGSMLGAVRHKGFIPWDDDVDVAFLREDFEKFKKIAPKQLSDKYFYQTFENKNGYHFFFDKITAKNTYFATKYSDDYDMPKGVSLDLFVFDKTASSERKQINHFNHLMRLRLIMNVRWKNKPRKGKKYLLSKLILPLLRIFSMDTYSKHYDKALKKYENKDTGYVLPPATDHKYRGSMPLEWFDKVIPCKFENINTFIPVGYDNYLKLWYGNDYNKLLPLSQRQSSHDFYRLDIENIVDKNAPIDFNYQGEII